MNCLPDLREQLVTAASRLQSTPAAEPVARHEATRAHHSRARLGTAGIDVDVSRPGLGPPRRPPDAAGRQSDMSTRGLSARPAPPGRARPGGTA